MKDGRENLQKILCKFYFKGDNILNKIYGILEHILEPGICVISFMKRNIKLRQKKLLTINVLTKII